MHEQWTNAELVALLGKPTLTRRAVIVPALATGFCWGGRITWLYAAHSRSLKPAWRGTGV